MPHIVAPAPMPNPNFAAHIWNNDILNKGYPHPPTEPDNVLKSEISEQLASRIVRKIIK